MKRTLQSLIVATLFAGACQLSAQADSALVSYNVANTTPTGTFGTLTPTITDTSTTSASNFMTGPGFAAGNYQSFGGSGYGAQPGPVQYPTTLSSAVAEGFYFGFTVQATPGATLSLSSIDLSSLGFFTQNFTGTFTLESDGGGSTYSVIASYADSGSVGHGAFETINYSNVSTPIDFRLYVNSAGDESGLFNEAVLYTGTITVNGTVAAAAAPEPSTWALMLGGFSLLAFFYVRRSTV